MHRVASHLAPLLVLFLVACAHPPPQLTPVGVTAFRADRVIKGIAVLQEFAIEGEAVGVLTTADARVVVEGTRAAGLAGQDLAQSLRATLPEATARAKAIAAIRTALQGIPSRLSPATRPLVEPYITVVLTFLGLLE